MFYFFLLIIYNNFCPEKLHPEHCPIFATNNINSDRFLNVRNLLKDTLSINKYLRHLTFHREFNLKILLILRQCNLFLSLHYLELLYYAREKKKINSACNTCKKGSYNDRFFANISVKGCVQFFFFFFSSLSFSSSPCKHKAFRRASLVSTVVGERGSWPFSLLVKRSSLTYKNQN